MVFTPPGKQEEKHIIFGKLSGSILETQTHLTKKTIEYIDLPIPLS